MGLRINTNVISLISQKNLSKTSKGLNRALERLSSGYRINSARDDAAGLAISEGLTSQVRGLRQAIRNANDGIGFLATAEGALGECTSIAQRIRELAIQAANGTLSSDDRTYLNSEVTALSLEFDRIAKETDFNGVKLLDGSFQTTDLQVGIQKGRTISFNIGNARTNQMGSYAAKSGAYSTITTALAASTISVNGTYLGASSVADDLKSVEGNSFSAIAIAAAINDIESSTGVSATVEKNYYSLDLTFGNFATCAALTGNHLVINDVAITGTGITSVTALANLINTKVNQTGVVADVVDSDTISFTAEDGRNIAIYVGSAHSNNIGGALDGIAANTLLGTFDTTAVVSGRVTLESTSDIVIAGTNASLYIGVAAGTTGVDTSTALNMVDISSITGAASALKTMDNVMSQLSSLRADLGAVSNRLESTVSNLSTVLENVASANSAIKDTDVASETAELTRSQILQQAGISVLGQANITTQAALALLRF